MSLDLSNIQGAKTLPKTRCSLWLDCPKMGVHLTIIKRFFLFQYVLKNQGFRLSLTEIY